MVNGQVLGLLGRRVGRRADDTGAGEGEMAGGMGQLGQPEIAQQGPVRAGHQDIGRLHVAVDDSLSVGIFQCASHGDHYPYCLRPIHWLFQALHQ